MTSINFTQDEINAIFFAASEFVTEVVSGMGEPDCDTALLWLGIQHKALEAMGRDELPCAFPAIVVGAS